MKPAWYVSVIDAGRTALVMGPFDNESECRSFAYRSAEDGGSHMHTLLVDAICRQDARAWFYSWGMVKIADSTPRARFCDAWGEIAA